MKVETKKLGVQDVQRPRGRVRTGVKAGAETDDDKKTFSKHFEVEVQGVAE